ncbi:hypothetical protein [Pseudomonas frederiksbergensis]|uniref:hypothetical protein n=1 Tax=Pseudomonas frederiksbergensis TaxID=104087 RepID=UPI0011CD77A1|nr:hypothetical protein [Pseudomonas frederiksbergensis]
MMAERYRLSYAVSALFAMAVERIAGRHLSWDNVGGLGEPVNGSVNVYAHIGLARPRVPEGENNAFMTAGYQIEVEGEKTHG